jgi:sulfonate transport system substrate-binding protein
MNAGAIQFGATGDAPPIFAQAAGAPLRYVAMQPILGQGEALVVPPSSDLKSADDLRGKRIAFTKASSSHLLIVKILAGVGLKLTDVQPVYLSPVDAASAFARSAVDAWATWDPYLALAQRDQKARILVSGDAVAKTAAFYLASQSWAETAPYALNALLDALKDEAAWGRSHEADAVKIVAAASGLPPDIVQTTLRRGPLAVDPITADALARQQASADVFQSIGVIPGRVTVSDISWTGWKPRS